MVLCKIFCKGLFVGRTALFLFAISAFSFAQADSTAPDLEIYYALQSRYGLSEEALNIRLAAEAEATRIYSPLKAFLGDHYAGAWFDPQILKLIVRISDVDATDWVRVSGAQPLLAARSLRQLEAVSERLGNELSEVVWRDAITGWYINYRDNSVTLQVLHGSEDVIREKLLLLNLDPSDLSAILVATSPGRAQLSWNILGGDIYTWSSTSWCSVGFSVAGGFITAGHCGTSGTNVKGYNGQALGQFADSTFPPGPYPDGNRDRAWVDANANWTPLPKINGYSGIDVWISANYGGHIEAPIGTSVCRYGATTGGPDCGEILAKGQKIDVVTTYGTVELAGMTTADTSSGGGDSGGPFVTATGQGQGTLSARTGGCSQGTAVSYFSPLNGTLQEYSTLALLTAHGSNPPTMENFVCPDMNNSGGGMFFCHLDYKTQGPTQFDWTGPGSGFGNSFFGSCSSGWVTVQVSVDNNYGFVADSRTFLCPTGPPP